MLRAARSAPTQFIAELKRSAELPAMVTFIILFLVFGVIVFIFRQKNQGRQGHGVVDSSPMWFFGNSGDSGSSDFNGRHNVTHHSDSASAHHHDSSCHHSGHDSGCHDSGGHDSGGCDSGGCDGGGSSD